MNRVRRRVATGLVALATATGMAGTAGAAEKVVDYNVHYELVLTAIDNPCTPGFDDITLDGDWHSIGKRWNDDDGTSRYVGSVRSRLSGSAADGTGYGGFNHFEGQSRVEDGVLVYSASENHLLVSQGAAPNFTINLRSETSYDADGTILSYEVVREGTACRG